MLNTTHIPFGTLLVSTLLLCSQALAEPAALKLGETDVYPEVHIEYFQTDNAFRTTGDEQQTNGVALAPTISWEASQGLTRLTAQYRGNYSNADQLGLDFTDHILNMAGNFEFSKRSKLSTELTIAALHEPLGTGLSFGLGGELDQQNEFTDIRFNIAHVYGVESARGNIEAGLGYIGRQYTNNSNLTNGSDRTNINPYLNFSFRAGGDTRVFLDFQYSEIDYEADRLDGNSLGIFVGASWAATGKLSGIAKFGQLSRGYDNLSDNDSTVGAEIDINYLFNDISRLTIGARRSFIRTDDTVVTTDGREIVATTIDAKWLYSWTPRFETTVAFDSTGKSADCPVIDTIFNQGSLELNYKFRRWMTIGGGFDSAIATGTPCANVPTANPDYGRQYFRIFFDISL